MNKSRLAAYLFILATVVIWGAALPIIKFTLGGIGALPFLTYRFGLSALLAVFLVPWGGLKLPPGPKILWETLLYAFVTSTLTLGLLFLGVERTSVLDTTIINAIGPLVVIGAGAFLLRERVTHQEKIGIGIAVLGTMVAALEPIFKGGADGYQITGNILIYLSLLTTAASAVLAKKLLRKGVSPLALTNISFLVGFLTILPILALNGEAAQFFPTLKTLTIPYHLGVFYMAILSGTLAYALWTKGQKTIEIGEAAVFTYLYPLISAPLAVFWLGEKITSAFLAGALLVGAGVYLAEAKRKRLPQTN
ncbi:MAG: DMT family transporter [Patescibacteria group bacterium]